jgi:superfamily I DNA and/or RNA helicase
MSIRSLLTILRETAIIVFVMGQYKLVGQGPAVDRRQLNVLMTRSRCGVVLIGGRGATTEKKTKGKDKKLDTLGNIHDALVEEGRVATVVVRET